MAARNVCHSDFARSFFPPALSFSLYARHTKNKDVKTLIVVTFSFENSREESVNYNKYSKVSCGAVLRLLT